MKENELEFFSKELLKLWINYTGKVEMSTDVIEAYWETLRGYELARVVQSMRSLRENRELKHWPTAGIIISCMPRREELPVLPDPNDGPRITYAEYIRRGGRPYPNPEFHKELLGYSEKNESKEKIRGSGYKTIPVRVGDSIKGSL